MELEEIRASLRTPEALTPRDVVNMTLYLSSIYGTLTESLLKATAEANEEEARLLSDPDMTSSRAKVMASASEPGKAKMIYTGRLKSIEQMIQALKKAQAYFSENKY